MQNQKRFDKSKQIEIGPINPNTPIKVLEEYFKRMKLKIFLSKKITKEDCLIGKTKDPTTYHYLTGTKTVHFLQNFTFFTRKPKYLKTYKNRICIMNLSMKTTIKEVETFFKNFGELLKTSMSSELRNSSKGPSKTAFVDFKDDKIAKNLIQLDFFKFQNRTVKIRSFIPKFIRYQIWKKKKFTVGEFQMANKGWEFVPIVGNGFFNGANPNFLKFESQSQKDGKLLEIVNLRHGGKNIRFNQRDHNE